MAVVIVAVPSADDYIWQLSSEKIPHLTLLYLGNQLDGTIKLQEFIKHVVDTSLCRFTLTVDHRGVLGDQSADVLFFDTNGIKNLQDFRSYLLGNADIRAANDAVDQHPEWIPHLTLGFPETPAKPDTRNYPGTYSVTFDRIALWTGDFEGVEFPLKTNPMNAMYMSAALDKKFFQHIGVKGMKWGVHRNTMDNGATAVDVHAKAGNLLKTKGGQKHPAHEDAVKVAISKQKARKSTVDSLSNKELQDLVSRMNLEQQYSRLIATDKRAAGDVQNFLKKAQIVGKTVNDVQTFLNSPAGKLAKAALKAKLKR
jgi:2'-5' RNA ligase